MTSCKHVAQSDILIVDDLADNLRVLSDILAGQGYRIRAVRDGAMALIGAKAAPPDVILLDIRMPQMDGFEVCQRLKADPTTQHVPIIFLSALDEVADKDRAFAAGAADYITKPFRATEVQMRVYLHLTLQRLRHQVAAQQAQIDSLTPAAADGPEPSLAGAIRAVDTIMAYVEHLGQTPDPVPAQGLRLQELERYGQALRRLLCREEDIGLPTGGG